VCKATPRLYEAAFAAAAEQDGSVDEACTDGNEAPCRRADSRIYLDQLEPGLPCSPEVFPSGVLFPTRLAHPLLGAIGLVT